MNAKEKDIKNRTSLEHLVYLLMSFLFQKIQLKHGSVLNITNRDAYNSYCSHYNGS